MANEYIQYNPGNSMTISSPFGEIRGSRSHNGLDNRGPVGTPVYAPCDARITKAGTSNDYGKAVFMDALGMPRGAFDIRLGHIVPVEGLKVGDEVKAGQLVGYIGGREELGSLLTAAWTGPHVHTAILVNGVPKDPLTVDWPVSSGRLVGTDVLGNPLVVRNESGSVAEGTYSRTVEKLDKNTGKVIEVILKQHSDLTSDFLQQYADSGETPAQVSFDDGTTCAVLRINPDNAVNFDAENQQLIQEGRLSRNGDFVVAEVGEKFFVNGVLSVALSASDMAAYAGTSTAPGSGVIGNVVACTDFEEFQLAQAMNSWAPQFAQGLLGGGNQNDFQNIETARLLATDLTRDFGLSLFSQAAA